MVKKLLLSGKSILSRQQSSILGAAAIITFSSLVSAVLGLWRNRLLIGYFFAQPQHLDAYWVAFRLPELVFQLLVIGSLSAAFIPVFSKYLKRDRAEAYAIASSVMNVVLLVFALLAIVIFVFARQFTTLFTSANFSPEQLALATQLTRIMILAQLFFAVSNFLTGMIQAEQRFLIPALSPAAYNIGIMLGIVFLTPIMGIYGPAVGVVIGALLHLSLQLPLVLALGYRYQPIVWWGHPGVREMLKLMPPRVFAISVNQIELFTIVYFATALPAGSLTIINIATQLISAPIRVFSTPIGQASLPFLSRSAGDGETTAFKQTIISSLHQVLFLALPASMLMLILRIPLVRIAYGAAQFPWSATLLTGRVVALLALSLFSESLMQILTRAFYALHNTRLPLFIGLTSVTINIVIAFLSVVVYHWGVMGLAFGISFSSIVEMVLLTYYLMPYLGLIKAKELWWSPFKMVLAASAMGLSLWVPMHLLDRYVFDTTRVVPLLLLTIIASGTGGLVYLAAAWWWRIPELHVFMQPLKRFGNWRQVLKQSGEVLEEPPSQAQEIKPL